MNASNILATLFKTIVMTKTNRDIYSCEDGGKIPLL